MSQRQREILFSRPFKDFLSRRWFLVDKLKPLKQRQEPSRPDVCCRISALKADFIPVVSIPWKRFVRQFGPDFFENEELLICIVQGYFGDSDEPHSKAIFCVFTFMITLVFMFGFKTAKKGIPATWNVFFLNIVKVKLDFDVLFGKNELFGVKLNNLLFGYGICLSFFFFLILLLSFLVYFLPWVILWFLFIFLLYVWL